IPAGPATADVAHQGCDAITTRLVPAASPQNARGQVSFASSPADTPPASFAPVDLSPLSAEQSTSLPLASTQRWSAETTMSAQWSRRPAVVSAGSSVLRRGLGPPAVFRLRAAPPQEASSLHLDEQARLRSLVAAPQPRAPRPQTPRPRASSSGPLVRGPFVRGSPAGGPGRQRPDPGRWRPMGTSGLRLPQESPPAVPEVPALTSPRRYFFAASTGALGATSPRSASSCRVRTTIECASILKWRLAAARVSEKPKPSAPRVANSWFRKGRMRSGWVESKSLVATIGPACPPRRCLTYGVRGSAPTSVSLAASQSRASRRSSAHEVTDHTAASTPQSAASSSRASSAQGTATPEASSCACGREPGAASAVV